MRRIAMLIATPCTIDPRVDKEARDLAAAGYDVSVIAWDRTGRAQALEHRLGFTVHRLTVPSTFGRGMLQVASLLRFYAAAWRALGRGRFDAIHAHDLETLPLGVAAARRWHLPLVFDAHEPSYYADARRLRWLLRSIAVCLEWILTRRADAVLVTTKHQEERYRRMGVRRICVVANWPESWIAQAPARTTPANRPLTVGRIGSLYFDMGIEELVRAHAILCREFPDLRLRLAGQVTPDYLAPLESVLEGTEGVIRSGSYRYEELPQLYAQVDVAVLAQKVTPWFQHITPTKFFEALARGVPVITTDIGGLGEIVRMHGCGSVLEHVTPETLARALRPWLQDAERRRAAGRRGRTLVRQCYNWSHSRRTLLAAYARLRWPRADSTPGTEVVAS